MYCHRVGDYVSYMTEHRKHLSTCLSSSTQDNKRVVVDYKKVEQEKQTVLFTIKRQKREWKLDGIDLSSCVEYLLAFHSLLFA